MKSKVCTERRLRVDALLKSYADGSFSAVGSADRKADNDGVDAEPPTMEAGIFMTLMHEPYSDGAKAFVDQLIAGMTLPTRGARAPAQRAIGLIAADLMRAASRGLHVYLYRPIGSTKFVDSLIGYSPFSRAYKALAEQGMLTVELGVIDFGPGIEGRATRFHPTPALTDLARTFGIEAAAYEDHFRPVCDRPVILHPIKLRASSTRQYEHYGQKIAGKPMKVDYADRQVMEFARQVEEINEAIGSIALNVPHIGFQRVFNQGDLPGVHYNRGGRLYSIGGGYQQLSGEERARMTIDSEPVVEWDISSSHLTIATMKLGLPMPASGDLYAVPGIPRAIVKVFVNASLGKGEPLTRWPADVHKEYAREATSGKPNKMKDSVVAEGYRYTGKMGKDWPIRLMTKAALPKFSTLDKIKSAGINWGILQFAESQAVIDAVHDLCVNHKIIALPVHDSIICKKIDAAVAKEVLSRHFKHRVGSTPNLKMK